MVNVKKLFQVTVLCFSIGQIIFSPGSAFGKINSSSNQVTDARYARFSRGINLPGWMWLNKGKLKELEKRFSSDDLKLIRNLGFTFVRVPIDMENIYDIESPALLKPRSMEVLERGLNKILEAGLAINVDLHSISHKTSGSDYSGPLGKDDSFTEVFFRFWEVFASWLNRYDPELLIIEPMNEPVLLGMEEKWPPIQKRLIEVVRKYAPRHTILATGAFWSNISTLVKLEPLDDLNILYNFHFYEPHIFTHQGATWSSDFVRPLRKLPYPSSPEVIQDALSLIKDGSVRSHILAYGEERWDAEKIEASIRRASDWAAAHGVRLFCNEWGCYKNYTLPQHRLDWVRDVRMALEKYGIGWCMWEFDGSFGLVTRRKGRAVVDKELALSLGLNLK